VNFFVAQDQARRSSRRLVLLYALATLFIVAGVSLVAAAALYRPAYYGAQWSLTSFLQQQTPTLIAAAVITTLFILGASLIRTAQLSAGGSLVAQQVGGTLVPPATTDLLRSRLRNVVEEMAIASGVPVPEIYVLEREPGINAFAAGFAPGDAAIAVTRGALEMLDRDELQGVIGHEFSHILNGDMRLNIRLMGVLFGIMSLGLMGRMIFRSVRYTGLGSRRGRGAPVVVILGIGLIVLGAVGVFFARLIKAGVSRQREYLADASSVQFTRQTDGLANALKKIGGFDAGSTLRATDPEEVSHMLFGTGSRLSGMFATHPPLTDRIRALDPSFRESDYPRVSLRDREHVAATVDDQPVGQFAADFRHATVSPAAISASVGRPNAAQIAYAANLRSSIPSLLYDAAHSEQLSYLLVVALLMGAQGPLLERQFVLVSERLGTQRAQLIRRYHDALRQLSPQYRLPLLEITFPALRRRPAPQLAYLIELADRLIALDGIIDLHEFCFYRVLSTNLLQSVNPSQQHRQRRAERQVVRDAAVSLLRVIAHVGHGNDAQRAAAFRAGMEVFGEWGSICSFDGNTQLSAPEMGGILDLLTALNGTGRQMLLDAVVRVVLFDREITVVESELVRTICASLEIPLPPQIGVSLNSVPETGS